MSKNRINKTGRKRGAIWGLIRKTLLEKGVVTKETFYPTLTSTQARQNMDNMVRHGELERKSYGLHSSYTKPSEYRFKNHEGQR